MSQENDEAPAAGYLILAGIPAGLLLWLGCAYVLRHAGASEAEAGGTLLALRLASWAGLAVAAVSLAAWLMKFKR